MNERFRSIQGLLSPNQQSWAEQTGRLSGDDLMTEAQRTQLLRAKLEIVARSASAVGLIGIPFGLLGILPMPSVVIVGAAAVSVVSQYLYRNLGIREQHLSKRVSLVSASTGGFTPGAV